MAGARFLISRPMWGLANRLLALTSAMRLAERHQRPFYMDWKPAVECMAEFHDLFSAPIPRVRVEGSPRDALLLDSTGLLPDWAKIANVVSPRIFDHDQIVMQSHSMVVTNDEPFTERNPFYNGFALDMRKHFLELGLNGTVSRILDTFADTDFTAVIGVHIRRPPPKTSPSEDAFNIPSDEFYENFLNFFLSFNKNLRFYLSSNGPQTEEYFIKRFGDRILRYPKRSIDHQNEATAVQDALVDMILLSRTRAVLRYEPSTFAYFAGLIGHNPQLIIGAGPDPTALPLRFLAPVQDAANRCFQYRTREDLATLLTTATPWAATPRP